MTIGPAKFKRNFLLETNSSLLTELGIPKEIRLRSKRLFLCKAVYVMQLLFPWEYFNTVRHVFEKSESSCNEECQLSIKLIREIYLNMTDWKSLSSFIGTVLTGGILVSTFNFFYNDFLNQPNILITIDDDPKIPKVGAVVKIENTGLEPAANLYMQIKAPNEINVTNIESSEKFSVIENETDPNMERVYSPRFVHGEGSLSRIYLDTPTSHIEETNYTIYSTFDQGSSSVIHKPTRPTDEWDLIHVIPLLMFDHVPDWYKFYLTGGFRNALFWLFTFGIGFVLFSYFANYFVARRRYMSFVHEIDSQISAVYKKSRI